VVVGAALLAAFAVHALRADDPLLDLRLYKNRTFTVASITTGVVGAVLFGAMFILPLYYQVVRGSSALQAGLLLAPQGLGAMIAMPIGGRIVDRAGAGRVVPFGVLGVAAGTLAYTQVTPHTPIALLAASLFVRGVGMGFVMMPAMAAAYTHLSRAEVPKATTMINIVQRVGGSLGTALFAVVLERHIASGIPGAAGGQDAFGRSVVGTPVAGIISDAFASTFWVVVVSTLLALIPAALLPRTSAAAQIAAAGAGRSLDGQPARDEGLQADVTAAAVDELTDGTPLAGAARKP
jgi:predicted MFS family arabinose efflux permease